MIRTFVCGNNDIQTGDIYNLLFNLKRRHRRGWELKGKMDKHRVERVSSHVWGTEDIAFHFLPEKLDDKSYDKYSIIKMLHFHDSGESFTSDLIRGEKKPEDIEEELKWISIQSSLGMIDEFSSLLDIKDLYLEFESKSTTNSKYASDCDKLECLLQAKNYYLKKRDK